MHESRARLRGETRLVAGKHELPATHRANRVAIIVLVAAVLGSGVAWAVVNARSGSGGTAASETSSTSSTSTTGPTTSSSPPTSTTAPSSAAGAALTKARSALATCAAGVAAREQLARAAAASARDWGTHTGAELKLDSGTWTLAQAKAAWAASKAHGPADLQQFAAASAAVRTKSSATACRSVAAYTASTDLAANGKRCAARDQALAAMASTGSVVHDQWAAHLAMMANKAHTEAGAYHDRWMAMVAQAQAPLTRYAAAAAVLARTPTCSA
jgi:hypothetical protein